MLRRSRDTGLGDEPTVCAFVGLIDAEGRSANNAAYSPAGTQFQESLLGALQNTQLKVTDVYALRPTPSFPVVRTLWFGTAYTVLLGALPTTLLPFVNLGPLKTITSGLTLLPRLCGWAWRHRSERRLILLYNIYSPPGIVSVLAGWLTRTRVVAIVADVQIPGEGLLPATRLRWLDYHLQVRTIPMFDGLVVLTKSMAADFAPSTPAILMEGAVPDALLPALPPPEAEANGNEVGERFVVMYAGGLSDLKGVPLLLAAFHLLEGDNYALWITGRGPLEAAVREAAAGDSRITYCGFPSRDTLLRMYARADVLVNAHSARHGSARYLFPSKLIEYLATGVPVVSTNSTPEVAEIYGEIASVTKSESAVEIAQAILTLAEQPALDRRAIGARARDFVLREKSWAVQARRLSEFATKL